MKEKTVYVCQNCDYQSPKWLGQCPECHQWNTMTEETYADEPKSKNTHSVFSSAECEPTRFDDLEMPDYIRFSTGVSELDRVLGGGIVKGSVVLLAGEPGIGKSTLLMQICAKMASKILYVSGEESQGQLKLRGERLEIRGANTYFLTETNAQTVLSKAEKIKPDCIIIDSIQTMFDENSSSIPGSIQQVKECAMKFIAYAKSKNISVILVGHVNKDGMIAGPKVLEHMVDAVLHFEGERVQSYRIIRAIKNRFGSTNEIGVFEMGEKGLTEIPNPSEMLLAGRPIGVSGNCAVCIMEGTRPLIAEIQALVTPTSFPTAKRTVNGADYNRVCLMLAVLEKRLGLKFSQNDVYINVVGGLSIDDPSCDLALCLALISGIRDIPVAQNVLAIGEIGLAGEIRTVSELQKRLNESYRLGFDEIALPSKSDLQKLSVPNGCHIREMKSVFDALMLFKKTEN